MKRRNKILGAVCALLIVAVGALAIALSYDAACQPAPALAADVPRMRAAVYRCYGSPSVVQLEELEKPAPADGRLLVKVHAAAVNPLDFHYMRGTPRIMRAESGFGRPKDIHLGVDFAGTVEAVGKNVTRFKPGDQVFGGASGAFGEYVTVAETRAVTLKPAELTFEQAAAMPIAAVTALQALRDKGAIKAGQRVLINGASGGVGTFAVQIAKAFGAEVTGVCSTRNVELVRSLGADRVIDYTQEDFTAGSERYDMILDNIGNHPLSAVRGVLQPEGVVVNVGGPKSGRFLGPLARSVRAMIYSKFVSQEFKFFLASLNQQDLATLAEMAQSGKIKAVIDRHYRLSEVATAIAYVEEGHARGKVIIDVAP